MSQNNLSPTRSHEYNQRNHVISPLSQASPSLPRTPLPRDYTNVKTQILKHGRGLIRARGDEPLVSHISPREMPELPSRQIAEHAIALYRDYFHRQYPVLHWPTFQHTCESLYTKQSVSRQAVSVFFCVLAYGTLCSQRPSKTMEGIEFVRKAHFHDPLFTEARSLDTVVVHFLTNVFFVEMADIATASTWLASAIRMAQNLDFHLRAGQSESSDQVSCIWYSLYCWDR
jgi:hypothetical protein